MGIRFTSEKEKQNALNSIYTKIEAAGGIVKNKQGQLLFIFRHGKWDLPKGKIEKGENEQDAALREVEEECGIAELTLQKKLTTTFHTYYLKDTPILKASHWYLMNYTGNSTQLIPQTEEHISDARWMNATEIQEAMKNTYASIAEVMRLYYL
ncbi:MAG: NUDIX domain-containing protein [Bacteroidetes bacterium]|nr:NUDIX domain-containing protein [Bacteroidota bacterium]MBK9799485.1 NUDIX domain-containing protein [Bacteroidota bacterium]